MRILIRKDNDHLDDIDINLLVRARKAYLARRKPQVGDWVHFGKTGDRRRISYIWPNKVQTSEPEISYHLSINGYINYSGSLYLGIPLSSLMPTNLFWPARVWIWHHGWAGHNRGVKAWIRCRVWRTEEIPPEV